MGKKKLRRRVAALEDALLILLNHLSTGSVYNQKFINAHIVEAIAKARDEGGGDE